MKKEKYAVASVKAFIEKKGKILILRESQNYKGGSHHGRFVMPGGKVFEGEHFLDALSREIREECGNIKVKIGRTFHTDEWRAKIKGKPSHIVGTYFQCDYKGGGLRLSPDFSEYEWIDPRNYKKYDINEAAARAFESFLKWKSKI